MPELIKDGAPPFIVLTYATAMMAVIAAQISYIERLGLSKLPLFPPLRKINMFNFGIIAFVLFLINEFLALLNIAFETHFFDCIIISLFLIGKSFLISWIVWVVVGKKSYN